MTYLLYHDNFAILTQTVPHSNEMPGKLKKVDCLEDAFNV